LAQELPLCRFASLLYIYIHLFPGSRGAEVEDKPCLDHGGFF